MTEFLSSLSQPFMLRALIVGTVISVCAALLGVILVLKRYALIGHGLADIGFASLSLAIALGWSPLYVSMPIVAVASFAIMLISQKSGGNGDTAIGVVSTGALSVGIIITYLAGGMNVDVYSYMFGSVLAMSKDDVEMSVILSIIVLTVFVFCYHKIFAVTFDENFSKASGVTVNFYNTLISIFTAVTVVIGVKMMGAMLISSLIIFPSLTSMRVYKSFLSVTICSAVIAMINFIAGLIASYVLSIPAGASVVVANLIMFVAFIIVGNILNVIRLRKYSK